MKRRRVVNIGKSRLLGGLLLLSISLTPLVISSSLKNGFVLTVSFVSFCFGISLVSNYITSRLNHKSLIGLVTRNRHRELVLFAIGVLGGLVLEGYVTYLGGLWWYPFYTARTYLLFAIFMGGFAIYFFTIISSYYAIKIVLDKITRGKKEVTKPYKIEPLLYTTLLVLGILGIIYTSREILQNTNFFHTFTFVIDAPKTPYISFTSILIAFFSYWFISEFIEFKRKRSSLIKDTLHGYLNPLLAIFISSLLLLLYMELQNLPIGLWLYSSQPLGGLMVLGLPLWIYIGWPLHYVAYISFYRALGDTPSAELLAGDRLK